MSKSSYLLFNVAAKNAEFTLRRPLPAVYDGAWESGEPNRKRFSGCSR